MSDLLTSEKPTANKHSESLLNSTTESVLSALPGETKTHSCTDATRHTNEQENTDGMTSAFLKILVTVRQAWQAVNKITGFKFAITPPIGYPPDDVVGHWIELSRGVVPFTYVSVQGKVVEEVAENQDIDFKIGSLTAVLLMAEYVHRALKHLETNDTQEFKTILSEVYTLLKNLWRDLDTVISASSKTGQFSINLSKLEDLTKKLLMSSPINEISGSLSKSTLTVTETDLLCRILGLDPEFADKVIDIDHVMVLHMPPKYYIESAFEENAIEIGYVQSENLAAALHLLGMSTEKSQEIADNINSKSHQMYSPIYWAREYLEDIFLSHPLLVRRPYVDQYPGQPWDQWFTAEAETVVWSLKRTPRFTYQVIKFTSDDPKNVVTSDSLRDKFDLADHQLLFHGAKHADSVGSIVRRGINVNFGEPQLDFSNRGGFYLSHEFNYAKEWALRRHNRPSAVIVFSVPKRLLVVEDNAALDLSTDTALWSAVVTYNRTDEDVDTHVPDSVISRELKFIRGPVCQNGYEIESRKSNVPTIYKMDSSEVTQYCILDQPLADEITFFIVGIVFYNQPDKM